MNPPPPLPDPNQFNFDELEPDECPDAFALRIFADTLAWLITFCISSGTGAPGRPSKNSPQPSKSMDGSKNLRPSYRRFLALVYVYRPDLLDGRTVRSLAKELNVHRQEVNKYIADVSLEFKQLGRNQKKNLIANRAILRAAQLRSIAERNKKRKTKKSGKI